MVSTKDDIFTSFQEKKFMSPQKNKFNLFLLFLPIFFGLASLITQGCATRGQIPNKSAPACIEDLKVNSLGSSTIIEVMSDKAPRYTAFKLVDPPRVIVDIKAAMTGRIPKFTSVNDRKITGIELKKGQGHETTRMIVRLDKANDYSITTRDNIIVLTLLSPTEESADITPAQPRIFFKPSGSIKNQVLGIDFNMLNHGRSRLTITTDKKIPYHLDRKGPKILFLKLEDTSIPPLLLRHMDSSHFKGALDQVKPVKSSRAKDLTLAIYLREAVPFHFDQKENEIRLDFGATQIKPPIKTLVPLEIQETETQKAAAKASGLPSGIKTDKKTVDQIKSGNAADPSINTPVNKLGDQEIFDIKCSKYRGPNMTLDFMNAEVTNILRLIAEISNLNIIWGPEVRGIVTMRLKDVPWEQALDLLLENNNLGKKEENGVIWIAPITRFAEIKKKKVEDLEEMNNILDQKKRRLELEPVMTEYIHFEFADAANDMKKLIQSIMSPHEIRPDARIEVDERNNTIVFTDIKEKIQKALNIRKEFDNPAKQTMIEARIVEASTSFSRNLGIKWDSETAGWRAHKYADITLPPEATDFELPGQRVYGGSFSTNSPENWISNIGVTFAKLTSSGLGALTLDASLALAESEGKVKIISAPKVIATNGEPATISRGTTFYLPAAENVEAKEVSADLSLIVTPSVSINNFVNLIIDVKDEAVSGVSSKRGKNIKTKMMVKSGETIVIGGIYTENNSEDISGVPWLKDIPVLGKLFRAKSLLKSKTELLIFITPRVLPTHKMPDQNGENKCLKN